MNPKSLKFPSKGPFILRFSVSEAVGGELIYNIL